MHWQWVESLEELIRTTIMSFFGVPISPSRRLSEPEAGRREHAYYRSEGFDASVSIFSHQAGFHAG